MFKLRKTAVRRCRENRRFGERSSDKRFKFEGNSNITSNRVTIPPGFLHLGVRSEKVQRSPFKQNSDKDFVFAKGLFDDNLTGNYTKLRRSARISKKPKIAYDDLTASEYYYKDLKSSQTTEEPKKYTRGCNRIVRNNSKSLFRQINERCARAQTKNPSDFTYPISAVIDPHSKVEYFYPSTFCWDLTKQVLVDLTHNDYLLDSKLAIADEIRDINQRLQGKMNPGSSTPQRNDKIEARDEEEEFPYVPRREWVYQTPPRQRVVLPKVEECAIQPAVICTARKRSNIYELRPNLTVDLTAFSSRENVEVDGRYMRHLARFEEEDEQMDLGVEKFNGSDQVRLADAGGNFFAGRNAGKEVAYSNTRSTVSDLFAQVISRPTKTAKMSRADGFFARRNEEDPETTPMGPNLFQTIEEFERDFTFVEDNGTFKIVNTVAPKGRDGFQFKVRKNLFKGTGEKMFNFDTEEPNMFNFSKLKDN